jgi:hypothetical protein
VTSDTKVMPTIEASSLRIVVPVDRESEMLV